MRTYNKNIFSGASLIEVLITLVIASLGLLATAKMQWYSLRFVKSAEVHSVAIKQALMIAENLLATTVPLTSNKQSSIKAHLIEQADHYKIHLSWPLVITEHASSSCDGNKNYQCFSLLAPKGP